MEVLFEKEGYKLIRQKYNLIWPTILITPKGKSHNLTYYLIKEDFLNEDIKEYFSMIIDNFIEEEVKDNQDWWNYDTKVYSK